MYDANRRNNLDIQADIIRLALVRSGALKTRIVYQCNLNFRIVKGYLQRLIQQGLLVHDPPRYYATEKGITYLSRYEALKTL